MKRIQYMGFVSPKFKLVRDNSFITNWENDESSTKSNALTFHNLERLYSTNDKKNPKSPSLYKFCPLQGQRTQDDLPFFYRGIQA